jgi:hypothetical protein
MSTYRWELLHNKHLLCPPTAGNDGGIRSEEPEQAQGGRLLPLFHYMSTYRWELLHNMSTYRWE